MTQEEPHRINIKANKIQNNIEDLKKETNLYEQPFITQNSFNTSINDFNFQNQLNNNLHQGEFSSGPQLKNHYLFQTNKISQTKQNINFNPSNNLNIQLNQKDDYSSIKNFESIYKIDNLNKNNININNNKTELIGPIIYNGSYDVNNNFQNDKILLNKPKLRQNHNLLNINKKQSIKKRNIFNKFKVYKVEPKKEREKAYKLKHKRKYKPDDIRKKIKARFHKSIKNIVNENLRQAGSKYTFSFLPQIFISSISRDKNHQILNLSYRDLLEKDFISNIDESKYKNKRVDLAKYKNNLNVLEYLDKNPEICEKSGFDLISKMKYGDLLEEYFQSNEFDNAVKKLRQENEEEDYIKEYINKSKTYVKFFSEIPFKINRKKIKNKSETIAIEIKGNDNNEIKKTKNK